MMTFMVRENENNEDDFRLDNDDDETKDNEDEDKKINNEDDIHQVGALQGDPLGLKRDWQTGT